MPTFQALLDANVIIPAAIRDTLLRAAEGGLYRVRWSDEILGEVERNLFENGLTTSENARLLMRVLRDAFPEAKVSGHERLIGAMPNDPKDRHVLAAAVVAKAEVIVTANLKHFPKAALSTFGIRAQSPDTFLCDLFDEEPKLMSQIVVSQAHDLIAPPVSVEQLLDILATQRASSFAARVQTYLMPS